MRFLYINSEDGVYIFRETPHKLVPNYIKTNVIGYFLFWLSFRITSTLKFLTSLTQKTFDFFLKRFPEKMVRNAKKPQVISGLSSKKYTLVKPHRMPFFPSLADFLEFFQNFFETLVHYVKKPRAFFYSTARNFKNTIFRMHQDFSCSF